jgi:hypothetical protein
MHQVFIGSHNNALAVVAMCVGNPDCAALAINS